MEAVAQDPVIMAKLKQISEDRKPELEAYKKELMLEHGDDYVKINELLDKKQNELVLDDLVKLYVYHHNVTEKKKNQKKEVLDDLVKLLIKSNVINKERK